MNQDFFNSQVERLKARFGAKSFDPEFTRIVAREVFALSSEDFRSMVDDLIGTRAANRPPILTDFREGRIQLEKKSHLIKGPQSSSANKKFSCQECDGDGSFSATQTIDGREYAYNFRCPSGCLASQKISPQIPIWNSMHSYDFRKRSR